MDYDRIRQQYLLEKKSQRQIAKELGISHNTVAKYCKGGAYPGLRASYKRARSVVTPECQGSCEWISATSEAVIRRDLAKTWWAPLDAMPFPLRLKCAQKEVVVFYGQSGSAIHGHVALLHIHWKFSEKYGIIYAYEYAGVVHR